MIIEPSRKNQITTIKKGAYMRLGSTHSTARLACSEIANRSREKLGRLALANALQTVHLVFKAQLQFLQPHFF
jgi:hypothetical protein